jgi:diguanylate cyclase (GGDEF)-like protein
MTAYWVVMAAVGTLTFVGPTATFADGTVAALAPGVLAAGAIVLGVRRNRPRDAWPWLLLAVALVTNAVGDTLFLVTTMIPGTPLSWADLLYVATFPCILVAIVSLGRSESPSRGRSSTADALTVTMALLLAGWTTLIHPLLNHVPGVDQAALVIYPLADALLIAGIVRLYTSRRRTVAVTFLAIGAVSTFAADVAYATAVAAGRWHSGTVIDLGWLVFYAVWGAAGLHPSMAQISETSALPERDVTARRLVILIATSLTGPTVLLVQGLTGQVRDAVLLAIGSAGIFLLNLLRVADALNTQRRWRRYTEHHDGLTGLLNRARFGERLDEATRRGGPGVFGLVLINLDEFQLLNNTLGPVAGDKVLVAVARRLGRGLGRHDAAARLGGDEFALLVTGVPDVAGVEQLAARLSAALSEPITIGGQETVVSSSIGVTVFPADAAQVPEGPGGEIDLLTQAGLALRAARADGRGRWARFQRDQHEPMVERMRLRSALDTAVAEEEFTIRYQPIVRLATGQTVGMEALARWQHPTRGLLSPSDFIELAEETGLIEAIGDWVLRRAVAVAAGWHLVDAVNSPYVSVNVSARQVHEHGFAQRVAAVLDEAGLPPNKLTLELTESVFMRDEDALWADLAALHETGVRLAIDDFGTGFSSLSYLMKAPFDIIKIDKSFVDSLDESPLRRALVDGVVYLAERLQMSVVAEGIETDADRNLLAALGCPYGQGYLYSRPLTLSAATTWLRGAKPPTQRSADGTSLRA